MKIDTKFLMALIQLLWISQTIIYLAQLVLPNKFAFGLYKTFKYSILSCILLGLAIYIVGIYSTTQNSTCGTEKFNPITILSIYGSVGSLILFLIASGFKKIGAILKTNV